MKNKLKNRPFLRSMRARMTLGFAVVIAALMALICGGMTFYLQHLERREVDNLLTQSAREMALEIRENLHHNSGIGPLLAEESEEMHDRKLAFFVVDKSGHVLAQSQKLIPHWPLSGEDWMVRRVPFGRDGKQAILAAPWHEIKEDLREFAFALAGIGVFVVLFSSLAAWVLVGRTLSPIADLSHQAAVSTEDSFVQLEAPSDDAEVLDLVDTLNAFLMRQAQAVQAKVRFYAAASHELRTPLQALSGFLEVGLSRERPNEELRSTLIEAQQQSSQLVELVQGLLLLNQLDMATRRPPAQEIDMPDVIERILNQLGPEIQSRALRITTEWNSASEIIAPWNHIEMLVRNLLENAVEYATPGGEVRVQHEKSTLTVWNQCEPIEGWEEEKCFEPFFRPDTSRNSQTGGNGLGLAICKAICHSNDWIITLRQEGSGVRVVVEFGV